MIKNLTTDYWCYKQVILRNLNIKMDSQEAFKHNLNILMQYRMTFW